MAGSESIVQGFAADRQRQIYRAGQAFGGSGPVSPFLGTDTLSVAVWLAGGMAAAATPTAAWVDATGVASYLVSFSASDTSGLPPGRYNAETSVTRSGTTGVVDRWALYILAAPGSPGSATVSSPATVTAGNARPRLDTVYCTDEDVACRAPQDYVKVCPVDQVKASGSDGEFKASSPWVLTSASVNFENAGVTAGDVVNLTAPRTQFPGAWGSLFAVDSVSTTACTLRRIGGYLGEGQPPSPSAGLTNVAFSVPTFRPQIDTVSYDANHVFGIDPGLSQMSPAKLYDQRELRDWCVLNVLLRAYTAATGADAGTFTAKLELLNRQFSDLQSRLNVRWGTDGLGLGRAPAGRFNTRLSR